MNDSCGSIRDKIADAMTEAPKRPIRREIDEHVAGCDDCRAFADRLRCDDRDIRRYVDSAAEAIMRVESGVEKALSRTPRTEEVADTSTRRSIVNNRLLKIAAAAALVTAAVSMTGLLTGRFGGGAPVFADVLAQIEKSSSVTYRETYRVEDRDPFTARETATEDGLLRTERDNGVVRIWNINKGVTLELWPDRKLARIEETVGRANGHRRFNYLEWVRSMHKDKGNFVGREEYDGKSANVFLVKRDEYTTFKVWADAGTDLPLRIEHTMLPNPDRDIVMPQIVLALRSFGADSDMARGITISGGGGIQMKATRVLDGFAWNEAVDKSLFDLEPPAGYKVEHSRLDVSDSGELALTKALKTWVDLTGAGFPEEINDLGKQELVEPLLVGRFDGDGVPEDEMDAALATGHVLLKGLMFAQERKVEGSWGYAGEGVEPGDKDAIVCWWLPEDSDRHRVVYGDLRIGDATLEELQDHLAGQR